MEHRPPSVSACESQVYIRRKSDGTLQLCCRRRVAGQPWGPPIDAAGGLFTQEQILAELEHLAIDRIVEEGGPSDPGEPIPMPDPSRAILSAAAREFMDRPPEAFIARG